MRKYNLDEPYNNCIKNVSLSLANKTLIDYILNANTSYSQRECNNLCINLFLLEKSNCGCNSTLGNAYKDCGKPWYKQALSDPVTTCSVNFLNEFQKRSFEECYKYCPLECDSVSLGLMLYSENLISNGKISNKSKETYKLSKFNTYEEVHRRFASISVFYDELKYTKLSQHPKLQPYDLASNFGGVLGLFLGVSFLSFADVFEVLFYALMFFCKQKKNLCIIRSEYKLNKMIISPR